ncbi:MAG: FAD-dependent oxidoreductase, partial [Pseudomonadota bacterium]
MSRATAVDYDVVVVGGGLVGASLASLLADLTPLSIALLDRQVVAAPASPLLGAATTPFQFGLRVSAISKATWRLLELLRARPDPRGLCAYERMVVWEGTGGGRIEFDCARMAESSLGYIVDNHSLLNAFYEVLQGQGQVTQIAPTGVAGLSLGGAAREPITVQLDDG